MKPPRKQWQVDGGQSQSPLEHGQRMVPLGQCREDELKRRAMKRCCICFWQHWLPFQSFKAQWKKNRDCREGGFYLMSRQQRCAWDNDFQIVNEPVKLLSPAHLTALRLFPVLQSLPGPMIPGAQALLIHLLKFTSNTASSPSLFKSRGKRECSLSTRPRTGCFKSNMSLF